jgi:hypothetical protein
VMRAADRYTAGSLFSFRNCFAFCASLTSILAHIVSRHKSRPHSPTSRTHLARLRSAGVYLDPGTICLSGRWLLDIFQ